MILTSKQKGDIGIAAAIKYFAIEGHTVSIPLTDSQDYDILVDINNTIFKVQVKYTSAKSTSGSYNVGLRSISGSSKQEYKRLSESCVDYLYVYTENNCEYLIPIIDLEATSALTLGIKYEKYKIVQR